MSFIRWVPSVRLSLLQHLYNLVHVDLSFNNIRVLEAAHTRLGNIKTLSLAGNQLESLSGLSKLYSLVDLDLSHNQLAQVTRTREPRYQRSFDTMCSELNTIYVPVVFKPRGLFWI